MPKVCGSNDIEFSVNSFQAKGEGRALMNMHAARMALNNDAELREWAEQWLKNKERAVQPTMTDEEFDKHWLYVRPERMHEGAIEAVAAYRQRNEEH
jgi:5-formyltetrahydrofolate cyclo-ligase